MDLKGFFPTDTAWALVRTDTGRQSELSNCERLCLAENASVKRKQQFTLGRYAAHSAIKSLAPELDGAILRSPHGWPVWPAGTTGSISHTSDIALAVVSKTADFRSLGVDIQQIIQKGKYDLTQRICTPDEIPWVKESEEDHLTRLTMLFCAKEALFKALFPITGTWFGLLDATFSKSSENYFTGHLLKNLSPEYCSGANVSIKICHDGIQACAFTSVRAM